MSARDDANKMPCVGLYTGSITNLVKNAGSFDGLSGLTVDALYYVGPTGGLTMTPPTTPGEIVQLVGKAYSTTGLYVGLGSPVENS
jgi:hypothetical protein